jgi:hypothetical protein
VKLKTSKASVAEKKSKGHDAVLEISLGFFWLLPLVGGAKPRSYRLILANGYFDASFPKLLAISLFPGCPCIFGGENKA